MINVIKITELIDDKIVIITSGEDEKIKIWDVKFMLLKEINLRNMIL
jgi:hypothetical protein